MRRSGFTILEALVSVMILQVGVFGALILVEKTTQSNKGTRDSINYALFRNQIMMFMNSDLVWKYTLNGALNSTMACWLNQNDVNIGPRNCAGKSGDLVLYNIKGQVQYDFREALAGLTGQGLKCAEFIAPPAEGNPACPMKFSLKWTAECAAGDPECVNPAIKVDGTFLFNGAKGQTAPPEGRLNFTAYHFLKYCPAKGPDGVLADSGVAPAATIVGLQVISGNAGQVMSTSAALWTERLTPCRMIDISFQENMSAAPVAPAALSDAANRSRVCLYQTTEMCRFEFYREYVGGIRRFILRYQGVTVFTMPSFISLNDSSSFSIRIRQNKVEFAVDDRVLYTWYEKIPFPFQPRFEPASRAYSPQGFYNIQVTLRD
jgi:hypothetical protein